MKRLLLITEGFPYGNSEESFLQNEYSALSKEFDITILSKGTDILPIQKNFENERIIRYEANKSVKLIGKAILNKDSAIELFDAVRENGVSGGLLTKRIKEVLGFADRALAIKPLIREIVEEQHIDIIYTFWCTPATLASVWIKRELKDLKVVSRFHGFDLYNERKAGRWQPFRNLLAKELDALFFVSEYGKDYFFEKWNRTGTVHYLGTKERMQIEENEEEFVLVSCSNLIPIKRVDMIISMLSTVPDSMKIKWYHFGDGSSRKELETLATTQLGLRENIKYCFAGFIDNETLIKKYMEIRPSLFITTSSTEGGAPVSIQEALSLGIPCLGTNAGGIPEAIEDGYNGFLVEVDDDSAKLVEIMADYYNLSQTKRMIFRNNAYNMWKAKFKAEENAQRFVKEIIEIVS